MGATAAFILTLGQSIVCRIEALNRSEFCERGEKSCLLFNWGTAP